MPKHPTSAAPHTPGASEEKQRQLAEHQLLHQQPPTTLLESHPPVPERPVPMLLNPHAGSLFRSGLRKWLTEHSKYFRLISCEAPGSLRDQAAKLAEQGEPIVAAAGGDGTLMSVAEGLVGSRTALGILPCGTMNVFARELGIGSRRFNIALNAILGSKRESVDIFTINGKPFLQMAGFGLDARVIQLITPSMKKTFGAASHLITGMQVATERHAVITLTLPNGEEIVGTQLILGNGKRYGGEAHLFAEACYNDGLLDAVMIQQESAGILMEIISSMLQRGGNNRNTTQCSQFRRLSSGIITAESKLSYQLDGDYVGTIRPTEEAIISKLTHPLHVCVPELPVPLTAYGRLLAHPMVSALKQRLRNLQDL